MNSLTKTVFLLSVSFYSLSAWGQELPPNGDDRPVMECLLEIGQVSCSDLLVSSRCEDSPCQLVDATLSDGSKIQIQACVDKSQHHWATADVKRIFVATEDPEKGKNFPDVVTGHCSFRAYCWRNPCRAENSGNCRTQASLYRGHEFGAVIGNGIPCKTNGSPETREPEPDPPTESGWYPIPSRR